jgi:hypothetical protein
MATLNLTTSEFFDIVMIYLFDQYMNPDQVKDNKQASDYIEKTKGRLKPGLMKYYLDSETKNRFRYKRIKGVFDGSDNQVNQIRIRPDESDEEEEEKEEGKIKKLAKKVIKKLINKEEITKDDINILNEWIGGEDNG